MFIEFSNRSQPPDLPERSPLATRIGGIEFVGFERRLAKQSSPRQNTVREPDEDVALHSSAVLCELRKHTLCRKTSDGPLVVFDAQPDPAEAEGTAGSTNRKRSR